jgi:hypothetical protein
MKVVRAAAVQLSPVLYSREGTVEKVVRKLHELGQLGVQFATFPETVERGGQEPKILRLIVGNPLIMKEMARTVPDAASYAPVTILIDERADGVHLSYDLMASLIGPYGSQPALLVAKNLDAKIETLLKAAAQ